MSQAEKTPSAPDMPAMWSMPQVTREQWVGRHAKSIASECYRRNLDSALKLYRALPAAVPFHHSKDQFRLIYGSNQCLGGEQEIYDPVAKRLRRVDQIQGSFHVWSVNPETGCREVSRAEEPFAKGVSAIFRFHLSNGESFVATARHAVLGADRQWHQMSEALDGTNSLSPLVPLGSGVCESTPAEPEVPCLSHDSLPPPSPLELPGLAQTSPQQTRHSQSASSPSTSLSLLDVSASSPSAFPRDVPHCWQTTEGSRCGCLNGSRCGDERLLRKSASSQGDSPSRVDAQGRTYRQPSGGRGEECRYTPRTTSLAHSSTEDASRHNRVQTAVSSPQCDEGPYLRSCGSFPAYLRFPYMSARRPHTSESWPRVAIAPHRFASGRRHSLASYSRFLADTPSSRQSLPLACQPRTSPAFLRVESPTLASATGHPHSVNAHGWSSGACRTWQPSHQSTRPLGQASSIPPCQSSSFCQTSQPPGSKSDSNSTIHITHVTSEGQDVFYDFTVPGNNNYVIGSTIHHNSGKTSAACAEVARIVLGQHPDFPKYNGTILCVGLDGDHIGQNMWEKIAQPTMFQTIRDEVTNIPRAVRWDASDPTKICPLDKARESEWEWAPPFIPESEWNWKSGIKSGIAWEHAGLNIPRLVTIRSTGWKMLWHPSGGTPRRGISITAAWFDEEIQKKSWFFETIPRLLRQNGRFIWSATPQTHEILLSKIHKRIENGEADISEYKLLIAENPFVPEEAKKIAYKTFKAMSKDEFRVRWLGEWAIDEKKVYGDFEIDRLKAADYE